MPKYQRTPEIIEAVHYQYPASQQVKELFGKSYHGETMERRPGGGATLSYWEHVMGTKSLRQVVAGDWIVKTAGGEIQGWREELFNESFQPVQPEDAPQ